MIVVEILVMLLILALICDRPRPRRGGQVRVPNCPPPPVQTRIPDPPPRGRTPPNFDD